MATEQQAGVYATDVANLSDELRRTSAESAVSGKHIITVTDLTAVAVRKTYTLTNGDTVKVWSKAP